MPDTPAGEAYKGPCGIARDSTWLTSEDLPADRDVTVTIEAVILRKKLVMQGGREKANGLSLKFVGRQRELLTNATNRKTLSLLFGSNTGDWFGKSILLFVEQDVRRPDGTRGPAVRIRPKRVEQGAKAPASTAANPISGEPIREPGSEG